MCMRGVVCRKWLAGYLILDDIRRRAGTVPLQIKGRSHRRVNEDVFFSFFFLQIFKPGIRLITDRDYQRLSYRLRLKINVYVCENGPTSGYKRIVCFGYLYQARIND